MNQRMNNTIRKADSRQQKKTASVGIAAGIIAVLAGAVLAGVGLFCFLDSKVESGKSQARVEWFNPWDRSWSNQGSYKTLNAVALSYDFAVDFKETYHYYFAFDEGWYPYIVKMKGDLNPEYQPLIDYMFGDESMDMPEPVEMKGVAAEIEDDIREFAIESMNEMYGDEFLNDGNFEDYLGVSFLDTTKKPMGRADFSTAYTILAVGAAAVFAGAFLTAFSIKKRKEAVLAEEKERMLVSRMSTYCSDAPSPGEAEDLQSVMDRIPTEEKRSELDSIMGEQPSEKKGNMALGIIGALGGSLVGVALWLVLGMVGFIAGIAGFVMLKFALLGYQKLSGKLDKKGAVICLVIAAFMVFGANVLDYGISICRGYFQFDASFDTIRYVALNFASLMTEHDMWGGFFTNLLIGYGLSVWSSHSLIGAILSYREPRG